MAHGDHLFLFLGLRRAEHIRLFRIPLSKVENQASFHLAAINFIKGFVHLSRETQRAPVCLMVYRDASLQILRVC